MALINLSQVITFSSPSPKKIQPILAIETDASSNSNLASKGRAVHLVNRERNFSRTIVIETETSKDFICYVLVTH